MCVRARACACVCRCVLARVFVCVCMCVRNGYPCKWVLQIWLQVLATDDDDCDQRSVNDRHLQPHDSSLL